MRWRSRFRLPGLRCRGGDQRNGWHDSETFSGSPIEPDLCRLPDHTPGRASVILAMMGDNWHFLEQQERRRASGFDVRRSMVLYNNSALTKAILDLANAPDLPAAISLDDEDVGPFLIVTRAGSTVTLLDKGMKVKEGTWILPYGKLAAVASRIDDWRDRFDAVGKLVGPGGDVTRLLRRLVEAGNALTQEEFRAISAWQPVFRGDMLALLVNLIKSVEQERYELRTLRRVRSKDEPQLRRHWNHTWAIGHLTLLVAMDGREYMESLPAELSWAHGPRLSYFSVAQSIIPLALRGAWAVGEVGKPALEDYRKAYLKAATPTELLNAGVGLLALGARHTPMRGLVRKTLTRTVAPGSAALRPVHALLSNVSNVVFENSADWTRELLSVLGGYFQKVMVPKLKPNSPFQFTDPGDVPPEMAIASLGWMPAPFTREPSLANLLCCSVPLVASARPEQLYFPEAFHHDLTTSWSPEDTLNLIRLRLPPQPVRAETRPGPNQTCWCNSGRKFKKCHGK